MGFVRFVGLDVHKDSITIAVAEGDRTPEVVATIPHDIPKLLRKLRKLGPIDSISCCYEAGPTGFGLYRALKELGIECSVVAPGLVPKKAGDRIKTDKRDAVRLARFHRSGDLTTVHVPESDTEAMRDLERARDDAKRAERVCRHQLSKFLLRHFRRYDGGRRGRRSTSSGPASRRSPKKRRIACSPTISRPSKMRRREWRG